MLSYFVSQNGIIQMMYLLETVRFITVDSFSMFFLISAVLNLFGIHFICSLPTVDIYVLSLSYCLSLPYSSDCVKFVSFSS
jgi:hypothetical protein